MLAAQQTRRSYTAVTQPAEMREHPQTLAERLRQPSPPRDVSSCECFSCLSRCRFGLKLRAAESNPKNREPRHRSGKTPRAFEETQIRPDMVEH